MPKLSTRTARGPARRLLALERRRGVVSVVSMMFLILFGSLAAAMAILSRGNIVTAATHQHVVRALGAAETGLGVAEQRLIEAAGRFVVEKGSVDAGFGARLWSGAFQQSDGQVTVLAAASYGGGGSPAGLAEAVAQVHAQDQNTVLMNGISAPTLGPAPSTADPSLYGSSDWVFTPAVALTAQGETAFQITYAPLANGTQVRVMVTGFDFDYTTRGEPITRRIVQDFTIIKRVNAAILSPSKVMIGKNVIVEGDLGATYTDVAQQHGDPLTIKSDFWGLESGLDAELTKLFNALATYDADKDNRLRVGHPVEGPGIPGNFAGGYTAATADVTGDGYVDEFDVFIMYYDTNRDGKVVLSAALTAGTPAQGQSAEFVGSGGQPVDDDLALLLDSTRPDRNKNKVFSFSDLNQNGRFDPGLESLDDKEEVASGSLPTALQGYVVTQGGTSYVFRDQVLGFRDGVIDRRDQYAKVAGKLVFRVNQSQWASNQANYMNRLRGPIDPSGSDAPITFNAPTSELPDLNSASFTNSETALKAAADGNGKSFEEQVALNLGVSVSQLATWTPANNPSGASAPKYFPLSGDADNDGLPDNYMTAYFEKMPFNSPSYSDWYYRPVYQNMVFHNVRIPVGNNGLFRNCQFIGVTYVQSNTANSHINWTLYGKLKIDTASGKPKLDPPRYQYTGTSFPAMLSSTDRPVLMATPPLDKADIPANQVPYTIGYSNLPDPLVINGLRCIDTKRFSNNIRFHDSLFVGSIVSDTPATFTNARNKLQFTGGTKFTHTHPDYPSDPTRNPDPADLPEIKKSSMMLPNYSVDIGSFNSPPSQDVRLQGAVVAGVLDIRGNASLTGALLLTFKPVLGQAPLIDALGNPVGNPAMFNTTLGYFGPADGDPESLDPATLPIVNGQKIVGWDLDGDGLADLGPTQTPTAAQLAAGATAVPFYGYGNINLRFDPDMALPDGILLPLQIDIVRSSYKETAK
jgi:hypothetical protein